MAANDPLTRAVRKGEKAEAAALANSQAAGQIMGLNSGSLESGYIDHQILERWGYTKLVEKWAWPKVFNVMLKDLGRLSEEPAFEVAINHRNQFDVDGEIFDPIDAILTNIVDRKNELLVAWESRGPANAGGWEQPIPDLNHWSDIAFLAWTDPLADPSGGGGDLKYVLRWATQNLNTQEVIERIMKDYRRQNHIEDASWYPGWPGISFGANSEELQALLETPNGHEVVWLIIQYRTQLGHKTFDNVVLFFGGVDNNVGKKIPSLLFCLDAKAQATEQ